jgi:DNA-binding CsgD family transcriptional regulator
MATLSNREWEVIKLLLEGKSNKLIASSLHITDRTVEFHLKNIYTKSNVSSRLELGLKLKHATNTKYADFSGKATRPEFWWFMLFVTLVASALAYLSEQLVNVFLIATLLPLLAVGARRLRDIGKSPWWQLFLLVPVGGIMILGILWARPENKFSA